LVIRLNFLALKMKKLFKNNKAFTLIELIVVIAIIGIFSSIFLLNYHIIKKRIAVERTASSLVQDIRRAEEFAISAKEEICPDNKPAKSFGIFFGAGGEDTSGRYILYANCGDESNKKYYEKGVDKVIDIVELPEDIKATLIFDLNGDGKIDGDDCRIIDDEVGNKSCSSPDWCNGADINRDGKVSIEEADICFTSEERKNGISIAFEPPNPDVSLYFHIGEETVDPVEHLQLKVWWKEKENGVILRKIIEVNKGGNISITEDVKF